MTSARVQMEELLSIDIEIKRNLEALKKLRERKRTLETNVKNFLHEKELPGVRCNGDLIVLERKNKLKVKTKKTRDEEIINFLKTNGVANADIIAKQLKSIGKEQVETESLKISKQHN